MSRRARSTRLEKQRARTPGTLRGLAFCFLSGLTLGGCAESLPVVPVLQDSQCNTARAGVHVVDYEQVAKLRGVTLIDVEQDPGAARALHLVAVSKGQQRTAGFALTLTDAVLEVGTVTVRVNWTEPGPDDLVPQALTHPCLVVGVPRGAYTRIEVVDQNGVALGSVTVEPAARADASTAP